MPDSPTDTGGDPHDLDRRVRTLEISVARLEQIAVNTQPIWALQETNRVAEGLRERAQSIERHAGEAADVLEGATAAAD